MLKMRLQRIGRKNDPSFRVVVTDSRRGPKSGKHVDLVGSYNPKMNRVQVDADKAKKWIADGVQVSDTLHNLLVGQNIIEGKKVNVLPRKAPIAKESDGTDAAPAAAAAPEGDETPAEGDAGSTPEADADAPAESEATESDDQKEEVEATGESEDAAPSPESGAKESDNTNTNEESADGAVEEKKE